MSKEQRNRPKRPTHSRERSERSDAQAAPPSPALPPGGSDAPAAGEGPPNLHQQIVTAVNQVLDDGSWGVYDGPATQILQARIQSTFGAKHAHLCCSGTVAMELALRGIGLGGRRENVNEADWAEVIVAGYDFPGNFRAIENVGALPVLGELTQSGFVLDPDQITSAISDKTVAIIASNLHGDSVQIERLWQIVQQLNDRRQNQIALIADRCQDPAPAPILQFADAATLSFGGSKLLTAGRGGAVLTCDDPIAQRIKIYCDRGNDAFPLSQLQAAVLVPQIDALAEMNRRRQESLRLFCSIIESNELFRVPPAVNTCNGAIYKIPLVLDSSSGSHKRREDNLHRLDAIIGELRSKGVHAGSAFRGFFTRSQRRCRKPVELIECRRAAETTILIDHAFLLAGFEIVQAIADAVNAVGETHRSRETECRNE